MAKAASSEFSGFPKGAMKFWRELAAEMSKPWFEANKARYQREWIEPMTALLSEAQRRLRTAYKPFALGEPKVMRIHRDVRFSRDKTPYKTNIGAAIPLAGASMAEGGCAAMYVHLGLDEQFCGVGVYTFGPEQLPRWRSAVDGKAGAELATVVNKLRKQGYQVSGHDDYKRVPKPWAEDHPRAEFLRMKGLTAAFPALPKGMIHEAGFAEWLVEHGTAAAPLIKWLAKNVAS